MLGPYTPEQLAQLIVDVSKSAEKAARAEGHAAGRLESAAALAEACAVMNEICITESAWNNLTPRHRGMIEAFLEKHKEVKP